MARPYVTPCDKMARPYVTPYSRGLLGITFKTDDQNTKTYFRTNQHGDVSAITTSAGALRTEYRYDAYGNITSDIQADDTNPFLYCGEYLDDETGLVYLRNRYYDPEVGRFITQDPIKDGFNWYSYCGDNPVMFVDPWGLKDVMLRYIVKKNGGSVSYNPKTNYATISMDGYKDLEVAGQIVNGRMLVDHEFLMNNFNLSEFKALHNAGDRFDTIDDTALAFGLMYYDKSMLEHQEYGASIDRDMNRNGDKYYFNNVMTSEDTFGKRKQHCFCWCFCI